MTELVLDASVLLKWFRREGEEHLEHALALRSAFQEGQIVLLTPSLIELELINVAGRRWRWGEDRLVAMAARIRRIGLRLVEPEPERVARWTGRGLTAYDAAYVAVAEAAGAPLITSDEVVLSTAGPIARPLSRYR